MHRNASRPLSPHLSIWRWGPHMAVSILHRVTGTGLALGAILLTWWLAAAASGRQAYDAFVGHATAWYGLVVLIGLTWAFYQHTLSGLRHFVMDMGAGYSLDTNKFWATMTMIGAVVLTALTWIYILGVR